MDVAHHRHRCWDRLDVTLLHQHQLQALAGGNQRWAFTTNPLGFVVLKMNFAVNLKVKSHTKWNFHSACWFAYSPMPVLKHMIEKKPPVNHN